MTTPITLADLRKSSRGDAFFAHQAACVVFVNQLLAAPERVQVTDRYEVRAYCAGTLSVVGDRRSARRELKHWRDQGQQGAHIVHVTVFRTVKK